MGNGKRARQDSGTLPAQRRNSTWRNVTLAGITAATVLVGGRLLYWAGSEEELPLVETVAKPVAAVAEEKPRRPVQDPIRGMEKYVADLGDELRGMLAEKGYVIIHLEERENNTTQQINEITTGVKENFTPEQVKTLGTEIGIDIQEVLDAHFVSPARGLEEEVIRSYVQSGITDFNAYIEDLQVEKYVPAVGFPKTTAELRSMRYPTIYYVGSSIDVSSARVLLESGKTAATETAWYNGPHPPVTGGGVAKRFMKKVLDGKGSVRIGYAAPLVHTTDSQFPVNVFDPSPVMQYFHTLLTPLNGVHYAQELNRLHKANPKASQSMDTLQGIGLKWSKRQEILVNAFVCAWLEGYLKRNHNLGLSETQAKTCFSNLDDHLGTRSLMEKVKTLGPAEVYRLHVSNPQELFKGIPE